MYNIPHVNQVYMIFTGPLADGAFAPGVESLETALYEEADIPWSEIAFPVVDNVLKRYFRDRQHGNFATFVDTVEPRQA